jgi:hypothetical protein
MVLLLFIHRERVEMDRRARRESADQREKGDTLV